MSEWFEELVKRMEKEHPISWRWEMLKLNLGEYWWRFKDWVKGASR